MLGSQVPFSPIEFQPDETASALGLTEYEVDQLRAKVLRELETMLAARLGHEWHAELISKPMFRVSPFRFCRLKDSLNPQGASPANSSGYREASSRASPGRHEQP